MNAWRQLLVQVVLRRRAQGRPWVTWGLLAALLPPLAGGASGKLSPAVAGMVAAGLLSTLALLWWGLYLQTAMRLNTPASACLVPGMRRRLVALTAALWLAGSLPPAALFGAATGHAGYALLASAASLQYIALCGRYPWLGFAPSLVWFATRLPGFPGTGLGPALAAAGEPALTFGGMMALAVSGSGVLRVLFPRGGDKHYRIGACLARRALDRKEGRSTMAGRDVFRMLDGFYHARLATPGRPGSRMLDALGGRAHWSRPVLCMLALAAGALACRAFVPAEPMRPFIPLLLVSMVLVVMTHVDGVLGAVGNSRAEQGILRLAPAAPPPRDLNRQLAIALLGRFGMAWGTYLACSVAVVLATTGSWRAWLCCTVLALAFAPLLLRDHARHPGWRAAQVMAGAIMLVMAPLSGVVEYGKVPGAAVLSLCTVVLGGTAVAFAYRWRLALAAAPAFPAGRMAT